MKKRFPVMITALVCTASLAIGVGASGVIKKGDGIQVIYGPIVSNVKSSLENYMDTVIEEEEVPCEKGKCEIFTTKSMGKS